VTLSAVITITCNNCGAVAIKTQPARFCSRHCKALWWSRRRHSAIRPTKFCSVCDAPLPWHRSKFCSRACNRTIHNPKRPLKNCKQCGAGPLPARRLLCDACGLERRRQRNAESLRRLLARGKSRADILARSSIDERLERLRQSSEHNRAKYQRNRDRALQRRRERRAIVQAAKQLMRELKLLPPLPPKQPSGPKKLAQDHARILRHERINEAKRLWCEWSRLLGDPPPFDLRCTLYKYISEILALRGERVSWMSVYRWRRKNWPVPAAHLQRHHRSDRYRKRYLDRHRERVNAHRRARALEDAAVLTTAVSILGEAQ
jgi:hypothetical protein